MADNYIDSRMYQFGADSPMQYGNNQRGTLSPLYDPLDAYTEAVNKLIDRAVSGSGTQWPARPGMALSLPNAGAAASMLLTGGPELLSSGLKAASAPLDLLRSSNHTTYDVDLGWRDAFNVGLAGVGGRMFRGKRADKQKEPAQRSGEESDAAHAAYMKAKDDRLSKTISDSGPQSVDMPALGYRGSIYSGEKYKGANSSGVWASDNPKIANTYAEIAPEIISSHSPTVTPMQFHFQKPLVVGDPKVKSHLEDISIGGKASGHDTETIADYARRQGHDGVVYRNVVDPSFPGVNDDIASTVYHAIQRGTVRSPLTGELLYGGVGAGAAGAAAGSALTDDDMVESVLRYYRGE